jgi:hypothetical protein
LAQTVQALQTPHQAKEKHHEKITIQHGWSLFIFAHYCRGSVNGSRRKLPGPAGE